mmetsp:Transcript_79923/g.159579  ORF Transcript_79923/g.159579 Transcript_79923/m.159579 type:complete len:317 (-) Transcript_79923:132-1082(-)
MGKSSIIPVAFMLFAVPAVSFQNRFLTARTSWGKKLQLAASALEPPLERSMFLESSDQADIQTLKSQVLQLAASLDRGQSYNPTSGEYYRERFEVARQKVKDLVAAQPGPLPTSLEEMEGEWELVFTSVKHGIFRSSPFFLAIQEAFGFSEEPLAFGQPKADLFFKLHELQTCSWGASKIGRVAQVIDAEKGMLFSEFDTSLFSLTVIPILGWFKLLPTFGGCVITASKCRVTPGSRLEMEVEYTTSKPVPGLQGLGEWIWSVKVPVGAVWKLLPWNQGRPASCSVAVVYLDSDFRVVQDNDGELFVYTRPVVPRP